MCLYIAQNIEHLSYLCISTYSIITMEFKDRLKKARAEAKLSQSRLGGIIGVHVTNISRYERGENKPTSAVLTKLADALGVSADYLMNGSLDENADRSITDKTLLEQFKKVEKLSPQKKVLIKEFLDAFLMKAELQKQFSL